jgi:prepilin peptidase CpaA
MMDTSSFCAIGVALAACVTDLRVRRIPNVLTFGAAGAALIFHAVAPTGHGLVSALAGWLVGAAVLFLPFALGGLGAGDVKLLAALGAWLGPLSALWLGLYAGMAGGVLAVIVAAFHGYLKQAIANVWLLLQHWTVMGLRPLYPISLEGSHGPRLAYALPILAGVLLNVWLR